MTTPTDDELLALQTRASERHGIGQLFNCAPPSRARTRR